MRSVLVTIIFVVLFDLDVRRHALGGETIMSPRVAKLVTQATMKNSMSLSGGVNKDSLSDGDISEAVKLIERKKDYSAFYLLYAIRKYFPHAYGRISVQVKSVVLCSTLKNAKSMNDWGDLASGGAKVDEAADYEAALMLIELGKESLPFLEPLLEDKEPARLFGSRIAVAASKYNYRRCDYAYRYISLIVGQTPDFREDSTERDIEIAKLKKILSNKVKEHK